MKIITELIYHSGEMKKRDSEELGPDSSKSIEPVMKKKKKKSKSVEDETSQPESPDRVKKRSKNFGDDSLTEVSVVKEKKSKKRKKIEKESQKEIVEEKAEVKRQKSDKSEKTTASLDSQGDMSKEGKKLTAEQLKKLNDMKERKREKRRKKKELKRQAKDTQKQVQEGTKAPDSSAKDQAINYLRTWKSDRSNWKFNKVRQVWLLKNMYKESQVCVLILFNA